MSASLYITGGCQMARLYTIQNGKIVEYGSYCEAFGLNVVDNVQIAAVGAGGKSTILAEIAQEYANAGRKVVSTTTTHIWKPDKGVFQENIAMVKEALELEQIVTVGNLEFGSNNKEKLSGVSNEFLKQLKQTADCIVVEADGAKMLPLKVPASHEPVIPSGTDLVLGIAGIQGIGKPIQEVIHRFEIAAKVLHKSGDEIVDYVDIACLLGSDCGQRKNIGQIRYIPILNQVHTEEDWRNAKLVASQIPCCWMHN